jgi:glutamate-ammonia-ligase adenylyltransferase
MPNAGRLLALARRIDASRVESLHAALPKHAAAVLLATAYPALSRWLEQEPALATHESIEREALAVDAAPLRALDGDDFCRALRQFARRHRMRIALRELLPLSLGGTTIEDSAAEISDLADVTIDLALDEAKRALFKRLGTPVDDDGHEGKLVVLGMGKLGGRELNCGSDVDLVCFYDSDAHEARSGDRTTSAHEVWTKVVQRMTTNLEDVSEHGFVWRVDHRLRPEGAAGALVNSLAAAERYYELFGRLWERAAWLRARPVAGHMTFGRRVLRMLDPFVWRRTVDPHIAVNMYELVHRARAQLSLAPGRDLKLGPGGIREAEFFVQALQLIWGGREPRLRVRNTITAINRLRAAGLVTEREAQEVASAYAALRRAEHAVQWASGLQTHTLPRAPAALGRIARTLRFDDQQSFLADLEAHTTRVSALLTSLLPTGETAMSKWNDALLALDKGNYEELCEALLVAGMPDADDEGELARDLFEMSRHHAEGPLGARSRERWRNLADTLLGAIADAADPTQAARFLRGFSVRLSPPAVYTRMLADDPAALRRLITVLGGSVFVGEAVSRRPDLADLVLFEPDVPTPDEARAEVVGIELRDDVEELVGVVRRSQRRIITQVAIADLADAIDTRDATLTLSALADGVLEVATRFALGAAADEPVRGLAVIAMGSLGGNSIGYGSDLDVIFLYDDADIEDPVAYFTKRARAIIRFIEMPHFDGPGYQLDTRLRPSGNQGLLVTSLDSFARYHGVGEGASHKAATWERLALLRARFAAGDSPLGQRVIAIARSAAYDNTGDLTELASDVHRLRKRMEDELAKERPGRYDIKVGRGGLIDVEFTVQLLQLRHGSTPSVRTTDTRQAIEALAQIGALDTGQAGVLRDGYAFLRRLEQRVRVLHGDSSHLIEERAAGLVPLARRMGFREREAATSTERLLERYRAVTTRIRQVYEEIVVGQAT